MTDENGQFDDDDRWLAAEYALGVLDAKERTRAETLIGQDAAFAADVHAWETRLGPMLDAVPPQKVPARVWKSIEAELHGPAHSENSGLWSSLTFWRWISFGTGTLAAAAIAGLVVLSSGADLLRPIERAPLVATLNADGAVPAFVVQFDSTRGELLVRASTGDKTEVRVPELWVIPADGKPRSLGVLPAAEPNADVGTSRIVVPDTLRNEMRAGGTLAISLEPAGGSPTGAPTGPVIASGKMLAL